MPDSPTAGAKVPTTQTRPALKSRRLPNTGQWTVHSETDGAPTMHKLFLILTGVSDHQTTWHTHTIIAATFKVNLGYQVPSLP